MADDYDDIDEQNPRDRLPKGYFDFSYLYKPLNNFFKSWSSVINISGG